MNLDIYWQYQIIMEIVAVHSFLIYCSHLINIAYDNRRLVTNYTVTLNVKSETLFITASLL